MHTEFQDSHTMETGMFLFHYYLNNGVGHWVSTAILVGPWGNLGTGGLSCYIIIRHQFIIHQTSCFMEKKLIFSSSQRKAPNGSSKHCLQTYLCLQDRRKGFSSSSPILLIPMLLRLRGPNKSVKPCKISTKSISGRVKRTDGHNL